MKNLFKRLLLLTLALSLMLSLVACSSSESTEDTSDATAEPEATDAAEEEAAAEIDYSQYDVDYTEYWNEDGTWKDVNVADYVTLPEGFPALTIDKSLVEVSDETLDEEISSLLANFQETVQVTDRAVADGDSVNIDYVGSIDGVEFDGGSTGGSGTTVTAGSTDYIDDFLTQIIDHTPGETFNVEVTFPDDYADDDLAGKDAVFVTTINYIEEKVDPELTDDFVAENLKDYYDVSTVDELKDYVRTTDEEENLQSAVQDAILEQFTFADELPESLIDYEKAYVAENYAYYASMYGVSVEDLLSMYTDYDSLDALYEGMDENIVKDVQYYLAMQMIAENGSGLATEDNVGEYFEEYLGSSDYSEYEEQYGLPYLLWTITSDRALQYMTDNAVVS